MTYFKISAYEELHSSSHTIEKKMNKILCIFYLQWDQPYTGMVEHIAVYAQKEIYFIGSFKKKIIIKYIKEKKIYILKISQILYILYKTN